MINQTAIFVDAGFLLSAGGHRVADTTFRNAVKVQYSTLIKGLTREVKVHSGTTNLRTYWYDASRDGLLTDEQKKIAMIPDVKVRLGRLNYFGEQKGVDLRLALDLVGLARTGSVRTAYLISGDDDLTEAVEEAQSLGLKVVLLGIPDESARLGYSSVADHLAVTVDSIMSIPEDLLNSTFTRTYTADDERAKTASAIASAEVRPAPEVVAVEASEEPIVESASAVPKPGVPNPAKIASRLAQTTTQSAPAQQAEVAALVYSSHTGMTSEGMSGYVGATAHEQEVIETARRIGTSVARTWYNSTTQAELSEIIADRPLLPPDIDRVLLKDCAQAIGEQDTYLQSVRRTLRWAFWEEIDLLQ
ncbi:NYN domain-containing protein [Populibacterium corticicola]|uniref:NYN domain-containing protein n=1 Tax=Populibacterium corticicola TaxID=1812826 RepID=A0ABW5XCU2_9MICO